MRSNIQVERMAFNRNKDSLFIINRRKGRSERERDESSLVASMLENELTKEI